MSNPVAMRYLSPVIQKSRNILQGMTNTHDEATDILSAKLEQALPQSLFADYNEILVVYVNTRKDGGSQREVKRMDRGKKGVYLKSERFW